jgi:hypothetical protein
VKMLRQVKDVEVAPLFQDSVRLCGSMIGLECPVGGDALNCPHVHVINPSILSEQLRQLHSDAPGRPHINILPASHEPYPEHPVISITDVHLFIDSELQRRPPL